MEAIGELARLAQWRPPAALRDEKPLREPLGT